MGCMGDWVVWVTVWVVWVTVGCMGDCVALVVCTGDWVVW